MHGMFLKVEVRATTWNARIKLYAGNCRTQYALRTKIFFTAIENLATWRLFETDCRRRDFVIVSAERHSYLELSLLVH
jgi:hypothetical protein